MPGIDFTSIGNAGYIDSMYARYTEDPESVEGDWRAFFAGFELAANGGVDTAAFGPSQTPVETRNEGVQALVTAFRRHGHLGAQLAPIDYERPQHPLLDIAEYGFDVEDLGRQVGSGGFLGPTDGSLGNLLEGLRATYCGNIGVEYMEIPYKSQQEWLQSQMEPVLNRPELTRTQAQDLFKQVSAANGFENFLQTKYLGHKRFSLEGGEALVPLLNALAETGADCGVEEMVMGMAHRGRLNVLAHVLHKPYEALFSEFEGGLPDHGVDGSGDVKYHLGYSHDYLTASGETVHLSLSPNPSHLELVNPVIEGLVHAKQEYRNDVQRGSVVPVLIHGDASFTGQGIITETLCLTQLNGYDTGGTVHVIVNNQIGFTATPSQTRFTSYPSDVAKVIHAPVFHVNGDDPEAVAHVAEMAMAFRQAFKSDVIIDMWCYRRRGHNEGDDPSFTQPLRYKLIDAHPTVDQVYEHHLVDGEMMTQAEAAAIRTELRKAMDEALDRSQEKPPEDRMASFGGVWKGLKRAGNPLEDPAWTADTRVRAEVLRDIADRCTRAPEGFTLYRKLARLLGSRRDMVYGDQAMDWGCAEMLAFGSLLLEGTPVRLAGQDCQRGTFSHRHGVWHDYENGKAYWPLAHLSDDQGEFTLLNSMLSELAVVGFEYGMSSADPRRLTIWEAQFGDFSNMAQPIVDQFISSAEQKWQRMSGFVMLLPHGYEGQGPEHSSARVERYLALCSQNNMQVGIPTLPSQYFHLLRRQILRPIRKPLVLMMPKSLLRNKESTSSLEDLTDRGFHPVLDDPDKPSPKQVERVLFCSGKVFFDLLKERRNRKLDNVAIVRIEELNPFPWGAVTEILERYAEAAQVFWVQEEPINMGSWDFTEPKIRKALDGRLPVAYAGRKPSASPATGVGARHLIEQEQLVNDALTL